MHLFLTFSAALGNMSKLYFLTFSAALGIVQVNLPSALACTKIALTCAKIREISATDQVAILIIERD